ncbi:hypothetical protein [Comamonas thiooxydans]|uniref:hypothetical protein n=1 Tax=Comamonas thiooxydans TaxID=363952 RepID=UPI000B41EBF5|nr:hypothetical protein [Comamonas thiooxydans]
MNFIQEMLKRQQAKYLGRRFSVQPHGKGYAIYDGRDAFHHGYNLGQLSECNPDLVKTVEDALNLQVNLQASADSPEFDKQLRQIFIAQRAMSDAGAASALSTQPWPAAIESEFAHFKAGASLMVSFFSTQFTTGTAHETATGSPIRHEEGTPGVAE